MILTYTDGEVQAAMELIEIAYAVIAAGIAVILVMAFTAAAIRILLLVTTR